MAGPHRPDSDSRSATARVTWVSSCGPTPIRVEETVADGYRWACAGRPPAAERAQQSGPLQAWQRASWPPAQPNGSVEFHAAPGPGEQGMRRGDARRRATSPHPGPGRSGHGPRATDGPAGPQRDAARSRGGVTWLECRCTSPARPRGRTGRERWSESPARRGAQRGRGVGKGWGRSDVRGRAESTKEWGAVGHESRRAGPGPASSRPESRPPPPPPSPGSTPRPGPPALSCQ